ncbi:RNA polymerase sigma factor [Kitasatospora camelliae]|uniref:RNA polymerase sigma factor n=1 Tax=Kitasatospora camelliae TaxID=3156397 RepID=A0AAU8K8R3_9ACTN
MDTDWSDLNADVDAARGGDPEALDRVMTASLPLVHGIVNRALNTREDADDIVQETMASALQGLHKLRDPGAYRSWLASVTLNELRRAWRRRRRAPTQEAGDDLPDPDAEFVDAALLRLSLAEAGRELAESVGWLDPGDVRLLSLLRLEIRGGLTRREVARTLGVTPCHAGVRIQRMKERLTRSRRVVRALAAVPGCPGLDAVTADWDGRTSALWRKRILRHIRRCATCPGQQDELLSVAALLPWIDPCIDLPAPRQPDPSEG